MSHGCRIRRSWILAGAFLAELTLFAQPERDPASIDPEQQLHVQIAELRAQGGPSPAGVIEPLRALALLYEERGDHALAIAALEDARHITRIDQGLSSADEALLLRQQIRSEKAGGNDRCVWNLEGDMVALARKHYDDIRMVPIFRELAEDRAAALEEYSAGGYPPEIELGCLAAEPLRYIDVAFDVTKYGRGERIEILEPSKNATRAEKRDLVRLIERTTFRPRFVDGELADSAPVVVRYPLGP